MLQTSDIRGFITLPQKVHTCKKRRMIKFNFNIKYDHLLSRYRNIMLPITGRLNQADPSRIIWPAALSNHLLSLRENWRNDELYIRMNTSAPPADFCVAVVQQLAFALTKPGRRLSMKLSQMTARYQPYEWTQAQSRFPFSSAGTLPFRHR